MKNRIEDLRNHLFCTLEALRDDENPMPIDRAMAVCEVSKQIIDSAKVEVLAMKVMDAATADKNLPFFEPAKRLGAP